MRGWTGFFVGALLVPWTLATLYEMPVAFFPLSAQMPSLLLVFAGAVLYVLFEGVFNRPMRTYVFGHELTHALASMAMGGSIFSFRVSKHGGSVSLSKTNFFVALAPYCVPLYTIFILVLYFLFKKFHPFPHLETGALVLVGASLAFHASLTLYALRQEQPDIRQTGAFFSMVFILLANCWILVLLCKLLFWDLVPVWDYFLRSLKTQTAIWKWSLARSVDAWNWAWLHWNAGEKMVK